VSVLFPHSAAVTRGGIYFLSTHPDIKCTSIIVIAPLLRLKYLVFITWR
jgi:hypothetical protein